MTAQRDLKRRVRERQSRTGESYMTALRQVLDARPAVPVPVVELIDITEIGAALGFACKVRLGPTLADRIDAASVLRQLRDALVATLRDPALDLMRRVVLGGESPTMKPSPIEVTLRFLTRVQAGIGGVSEHGRLLALAVDGRRGTEMVVFLLLLSPVAYLKYAATLVVTCTDGSLLGPGTHPLALR
jgi:hypothetical protein